jgi:hypothetical protein
MVCPEDYRAETQAVQAALGREVESAWEAFSGALEEIGRTGPRGAPDRTVRHPLTVRTGAEAERLHVGAQCPRHRGSACTVGQVTTKGRLSRKVTGAACSMPLWDVCVIESARQGAVRLCADGRGGLVLVVDWENTADPVTDISAGFFGEDTALIRSAAQRLRSLGGG